MNVWFDPATIGGMTTWTTAGASAVSEKDEWGVEWTVMNDPEGNEYCVSGPHH